MITTTILLIASILMVAILALITYVNIKVNDHLRSVELARMRKENSDRYNYSKNQSTQETSDSRYSNFILVPPGESVIEFAKLHNGTIVFVDDHVYGHRHYIKPRVSSKSQDTQLLEEDSL